MEHHFPVVHFENENQKTDIILTPVKSNKSRQSTLLKGSGVSDHYLFSSSTKIISQGGGPSNDVNNSKSIHKEIGVIQEQNSEPSNDVPLSNKDDDEKNDEKEQETVVFKAEPLFKQDTNNINTDTEHNQQQGPVTIEATVQQQDTENQKLDSTVKFFFKKRRSVDKVSRTFQATSKKTSKNASEKHIRRHTSQNISKDDTKADVEVIYACSSVSSSSKTMKGKKHYEKSSFGDRFGFGKNLHRLDKKLYTLFHRDKKNNSKKSSRPETDASCLLGDNNTVVPKCLMQQIHATIPQCIACLSTTNADVVHHIYSAIPHLSDTQDSGHRNHPQLRTCIKNNDVKQMKTHDLNKKRSSRFWFPYDKRHIRLHGNKSNSALRTQVSVFSGEKKKKRSKLRQSKMKYVKRNVFGAREKSSTNSDSQIRSRFFENQVDSLFKFNKSNQENTAVSPVCNLLEIESRYKPWKCRKTTHSRQNPQGSNRTFDLSSMSIEQQYENLRKVNSRANVCNKDFDHGAKTSRAYICKEFIHNENSPDRVSSFKPSTRPASKTVENKNKKRSKSCRPPTINYVQKDDLKLTKLNLPSALKRCFSKALQIKDHRSKINKSPPNHSNKKYVSSSDNINTEHYLDSTDGICKTNSIQNKESTLTKRKKSTLLRFCLPENNKHEVLASDKRAYKSNINQNIRNNEISNKEEAPFKNDRTINTLHLQRSMLEKKPNQKATRTKKNRTLVEKKTKIGASKPGKIYIQRKKNFEEYGVVSHLKDSKSYKFTVEMVKNQQENITSNTTNHTQASFTHLQDHCAYNSRVCQFGKVKKQSINNYFKSSNEMDFPIVSTDSKSYKKKIVEKEKRICKQPHHLSTINYIQRKSKSGITDLRVVPVQCKEAIETRSINTASQKASIADRRKQYNMHRTSKSSIKQIQGKDETVKIAENVILDHRRTGTKHIVEKQHQRYESDTAKYKHVNDKKHFPKLTAENPSGDFTCKTKNHDSESDKNNLINRTSGKYFYKDNTQGFYPVSTTKSESSITDLRKCKLENNQKLRSRRVKYVQRDYLLTELGLHVKSMEDSKNNDPTNKNKSKYEISHSKSAKALQEPNRAQFTYSGSTFQSKENNTDKTKKYIEPSSSFIYMQNKTGIDGKVILPKQKCMKYTETGDNETNRISKVKDIHQRPKSRPLDCKEKKQTRNNQENHKSMRSPSDSIQCATSCEKPKKSYTKKFVSQKSEETVIPCPKMSKFQRIKQLFFLYNKRGKLRTPEKEVPFLMAPLNNRYNRFNKKDQGVQYQCKSYKTRLNNPQTSKCNFGQQSGKTQYVQRKHNLSVNIMDNKKHESHEIQDRTPKTSTCKIGQQSGKTKHVRGKYDCSVTKNAKIGEKSTQDSTKTKKCNFRQKLGNIKFVQRRLKNKDDKKIDKNNCEQKFGKTQYVQRKKINPVNIKAKQKSKTHETQDSTPKLSKCNFRQQSGKKEYVQGNYDYSVPKNPKIKEKCHQIQDTTPKPSECNYGQKLGKTHVQRRLDNKDSTRSCGQSLEKTQYVQRKKYFSIDIKAKKKDAVHDAQDSTPQTSTCDFGQQSGKTEYVQGKYECSVPKSAKIEDKSHQTQDCTPKPSKYNFGQQSGKIQHFPRRLDNKDTQDSTPQFSTCDFGQQSGKTEYVQGKYDCSVPKSAKIEGKSHQTQDCTPKPSKCNFRQQSGKIQHVQRRLDSKKDTRRCGQPLEKTLYVQRKKNFSVHLNTKKKDKSHEKQDSTPKTSTCNFGHQSKKKEFVQEKMYCLANESTEIEVKSHQTKDSTSKTSTCNFGQQSEKTEYVDGKYDCSVNKNAKIEDKSHKRQDAMLKSSICSIEHQSPKKSLKFNSNTEAKECCTCTASKTEHKEKINFRKEKRKLLKEKQQLLKKLQENECQLAKSKKTCKRGLVSLSSTTDKSGDREISISGRTNLVEKILKFMTAKSGRIPKKQKQTTVTLKTLKSSHTQSRALDKIKVCDTPKNIEKILETMDDDIIDTKFDDGHNNQDLKKNESFTCDTVENSGVMPIVRGQKEIKISGPPKQVKKLLKILSVTRAKKSANLRNKVTISLPGSGNIQVCGHKKNVKKMVKLLGLKKKKGSVIYCNKSCSKAQLAFVSRSKHTYLQKKPKNKKKQKKSRCTKKSKGSIKNSKAQFVCQKKKKCIISKKGSKSRCKPQRNKLVKKERKKKEKFTKKICKKKNPKERIPIPSGKVCISPCGSVKSKKQNKTKFSDSHICVPVQTGSQVSTIGMLLKNRKKSQNKKHKRTNLEKRITVPILGQKSLTITGTRRKVETLLQDLSDAEILQNLSNSMYKPYKVTPCDSVQTKTGTTKFSGTQICLPVQTETQVSSSNISERDSFKCKRYNRKYKKPFFPNASTQLYIASTDNKRSEIFIQPLEIETTARKNSKKFNLCISAKVYKNGTMKYKQICIPVEEIKTVSGKPDCPAYTRVCVKPKYLKKIKKIGFCHPRLCFESKDKKKRRQSKDSDLCLKPPKVCRRQGSKLKIFIKKKRKPEIIWKKLRGRKLNTCFLTQSKPPMFVGNFSFKSTFFEFLDNIRRMFLLACTGCLWLPLICCYKLYCCIST